MDTLRDFTVPFAGLGIGNHRYELEVNDLFFEHFEFSQISKGSVKVDVDLEKQERMLIFGFSIFGNVEVTCDHCGYEFMHPVEGTERLIVKFGEEFEEESDEMITIPAKEHKIDLSPFVYEYIHLLLPARILHPDDAEGNTTCNPEALKRLDELSRHDTVDPRWEALLNLQNKKKDNN